MEYWSVAKYTLRYSIMHSQTHYSLLHYSITPFFLNHYSITPSLIQLPVILEQEWHNDLR
jgi:hypothetical protein